MKNVTRLQSKIEECHVRISTGLKILRTRMG